MFFRRFLPALTLAASAVASITYKGHDLSSLKLMEDDEGATFKTTSGSSSTAEAILASGGMNSVRLRLWVNPSSGAYDLDYTLTLAKRFHSEGYSIYLDYHFSDTWADPSDQTTPSAWSTSDIDTLASTLKSYVTSTLESFHSAGVSPAIVALGNEVSSGMLWPLGKIGDNDFSGYATLFKAAREGVTAAVSAGLTNPKVMIHLNNGWDESLQTWFYKGLLATGTVTTSDFDIMGVSFYPFFGTSATLSNLQSSLNTLASTYGKSVVVAETDWPEACSGVTLSESSIPVSAAGQTTWVQDVVKVVNDVDSSLGLGVYYWEPAFLNNTSLGSDCSDNILFDVDWSGWPTTVATARSSVDMFE